MKKKDIKAEKERSARRQIEKEKEKMIARKSQWLQKWGWEKVARETEKEKERVDG